MRKVNATLLYGIDKHNKYMVVKFFVVENNGVIHTIIDNANNMELAYKHESISEMVNSMKRVLKAKDLYVSSFMKNSDSECCGIVCLKMYGTDFLVSNPTRAWVSK